MTQRGLELRTNLSEPLQERQSLENLAFTGVDQDLGIFVNNLNNKSELLWNPGGLDAGIIESSTGTSNARFLFPRTVPFVYTSGDEVTIQVRDTEEGSIVATDVTLGDTEQVYYVVDFEFGLGNLRNQRAIGLSTTPFGSLVDLSNLTDKYVTLVRNDPVTQDNFLRIATPDILNTPNNTGEADTEGSDFFFEYNIGDNFSEAFADIENKINSSNFKRREKYAENESVQSERLITVQGTVKIQDPADELVDSDDLDNDTAPGIFITDPFSDINNIVRTRAFSSDSNPWQEQGSDLVTESSQVNIGDLVFADDIRVDSLDTTSVTSSDVATDFSHKIPVTVNGVQYFLLLTT